MDQVKFHPHNFKKAASTLYLLNDSLCFEMVCKDLSQTKQTKKKWNKNSKFFNFIPQPPSQVHLESIMKQNPSPHRIFQKLLEAVSRPVSQGTWQGAVRSLDTWQVNPHSAIHCYHHALDMFWANTSLFSFPNYYQLFQIVFKYWKQFRQNKRVIFQTNSKFSGFFDAWALLPCHPLEFWLLCANHAFFSNRFDDSGVGALLQQLGQRW